MYRCAIVGLHHTLDVAQILQILSDYLKTGTRPSLELSHHIISQLHSTNPELSATHRLLAEELAGLPDESCPYNRDRYMQRVFARLCQQMSTVKHPSIEKMFPIFKRKLEIVGMNIQGHNEIVINLFRDLLRFLNAYVNKHSFSTDDLLRVARGNGELFAISLRPMIQFCLDTITTATVQQCVIERLQFSMDAVHQMIALMSDIVHPVVGTILSEFERFNHQQREAFGVLTENLTNLLSNLGNRYASYVAGRPFDMVFLLRVSTYLSSCSCPMSYRPLVEAVLGTLQQGPSCLRAITCSECRHEHVVQKVHELTAIARNMPRQVPGAIQALEEIVTSLNEQRQSRNLELFMTFLIMRRFLQNLAH